MLDVMVKMLGMVWLVGLPISVEYTIGSLLGLHIRAEYLENQKARNDTLITF